MRLLRTRVCGGVIVWVLAWSATAALAQTFNSGSTGADGAFSPTANATLALPPDGAFNFTTINIPAGVTVRFTRNTANTPVTLLASGNVTIAGTIDVSGGPSGAPIANTTSLTFNAGAGGPGGFDGGAGTNGTVSNVGGAGLGPGGAVAGTGAGSGGGGGFLLAGGNAGGNAATGAGGAPYGAATLLPLIGGSGGGGGGANFGHSGGGGAGGGGALVIASSGTITFTGTILAKGGDAGSQVFNTVGPGAGGGGSGGAVRLVATAITGTGGTINANGGAGGFAWDVGFGNRSIGGPGSVGRIRIEGFTNTASINFAGAPAAAVSAAQPTTVTLANAPTLTITAVGGVVAPASPGASFSSPDIVLPAGTTSPVTVSLAASNIPLGTAVTVTANGLVGGSASASGPLSGTVSASTASVSLAIPTNEPSVIIASATFTLASATGGPVFVQGEEIERVRVTAGYGSAGQLAYITRSGREVVVPAR